jgi:hypothetical protein
MEGKMNKFSKPMKWPEVFRQCKLVLYYQTFDINRTIGIYAGDQSLVDMFGYEVSFRLILDDLTGQLTDVETLNNIQTAMEQGKCLSSFLQLYRVDGSTASYHITIKSIGKNSTQSDTRWAVMTLRSASSISNALNLNISTFGRQDIPEIVKCRLIVDALTNNYKSPNQEKTDNRQKHIAQRSPPDTPGVVGLRISKNDKLIVFRNNTTATSARSSFQKSDFSVISNDLETYDSYDPIDYPSATSDLSTSTADSDITTTDEGYTDGIHSCGSSDTYYFLEDNKDFETAEWLCLFNDAINMEV